MNKLQKLLTSGSSSIRGVRARIVSEDMEHAQQRLIDDLLEERRNLERNELSLTDLYPDSELSLRVVKKSFEPSTWAKEMQAVKVNLLNNEIKLSVAIETQNEWFSEPVKSEKPRKYTLRKKTVASTQKQENE